MGDRVWFATSDWPDNPKNSSGFNGFPFPLPKLELWDGVTRLNDYYGTPSRSADKYEPVVGPGTNFPIGMTLKDAVEFYWRVRTIKVHMEASGSITGPNHSRSGSLEVDLTTGVAGWITGWWDGDENSPQTLSRHVDGGLGARRERDLLLSPSRFGGANLYNSLPVNWSLLTDQASSYTLPNPSNGEEFSYTITGVGEDYDFLFFSVGMNFSSELASCGDLYYPAIFFEADWWAVSASTHMTRDFESSGVKREYAFFKNYKLPVWVLEGNSGDEGGEWSYESSLDSLAFSVTNYWPYADSKGDPVWNVDDGSKLRDPLG